METIAKKSKSHARSFIGAVIGATEQKTVHVEVRTVKMDPKYRKQFSTKKKYAVHDEKRLAKVGDIVQFMECRPISKTKKWRLVKVI